MGVMSEREEDVCDILSLAILGRTHRDVEQTGLRPQDGRTDLIPL